MRLNACFNDDHVGIQGEKVPAVYQNAVESRIEVFLLKNPPLSTTVQGEQVLNP